MYDYEAGMTQCQNEIRRLRSVVRFDEEKIERLKTLLYNAVSFISETTAESQNEWYEKTLGITEDELEEIGYELSDSKED